MRVIEDIKYCERENCFIDLFLPDANDFDTFIYFHGGGLEWGTRKSPCFAEDLTKKGIAVVSVEYRMYPTAKFPDFIIDCADAVKFVTDHISEYGNSKRIFVGGQSAGAYITLMLTFDKRFLENAGVGRAKITGFISDSAQTTTHFNVLRERGLDTRLERIDDASPMYHISPDSDFGNLLLIYYTNDMPARPEQNHLFYKSLMRFCPNQRIEIKELPGEHCNGSCNRNENGAYDFNDTLLAFIEKL